MRRETNLPALLEQWSFAQQTPAQGSGCSGDLWEQDRGPTTELIMTKEGLSSRNAEQETSAELLVDGMHAVT